ncbi:MAG TPA: FMN-binding protein [Candidatus Marinimicrobia bacterium]|nr:FMN-binding protein [Candidatus Neomarinimicrobiota bacterium]
MNKSLKLVVVLTLTALLSGLILAVLNTYTAPRIELNENKTLLEAIEYVIPGQKTCDVKVIKDVTFYVGKDDKGQVIGVAFVAEGDGFQSRLRILVGMDPEMTKIVQMKILSQAETPGLGTKIENDPTNKTDAFWFLKQFADLPAVNPISVVKGQAADKSKSQIQAITGATISSRAVVDIINAAIEKNRALYLEKVK